MRELLFHLRKALETAICSGTPPSSASTWRCSTRTKPASRWRTGSARMSTAAWLRARYWARRPCSSTASSTAPATTRLPCWPRWPRYTALLACLGRVEVELCQLPHDEAAVGAQHLAGHRRSRIGGQVGDSGCGVIGCEPPPERLAVHRCVELFVGVHDAGGRGVG